MVRRHFRRLDKKDFLLIYKTYIRPHLEYCVQTWSPHLVKDVRWCRGDLIEVHKILHGKERIDEKHFFTLADYDSYNLRGHTLKLRKDRSRLDIRKYFFSQRSVNVWYSLPQHVVDADSTNKFKNALDEHWNDMDSSSRIA